MPEFSRIRLPRPFAVVGSLELLNSGNPSHGQLFTFVVRGTTGVGDHRVCCSREERNTADATGKWLVKQDRRAASPGWSGYRRGVSVAMTIGTDPVNRHLKEMLA